MRPAVIAVSLCLLALVACSYKQPQQKKAAEETVFRKLSATEAFNLRSKCAELGEKINGEYDKTGNELISRMKEPLLPLVQEQRSHYNPKKNRCYVELRVSLKPLALQMRLRGYMAPNEFLKRFDVDYIERTLYDGQTGEELGFVQKGLVKHAPVGTLKGKTVDWSEASSKIDQIMADE